MPPAVQRSNAKHYKSNTITEITEFPGRSHLMPAQQGWEEIADYARRGPRSTVRTSRRPLRHLHEMRQPARGAQAVRGTFSCLPSPAPWQPGVPPSPAATRL